MCDSLEVNTLTYQHMKHLSNKGKGISNAARLFRVGKKVLVYDYSAFIFPKGEPCKEEFNSVLGKLVRRKEKERATCIIACDLQ